MEGSESSPISLATADPGLSSIPNPATGQAVYIHNSSNIINQVTCTRGGSTPAAVPPQILTSASATG
jgi:hypothetical protein